MLEISDFTYILFCGVGVGIVMGIFSIGVCAFFKVMRTVTKA